jgi:hypothetical protein
LTQLSPARSCRQTASRRRRRAEWPDTRFLLGRRKLLVLNDQKIILPEFISAPFLVGRDNLARHGIHELMAQAVPRLAVHLPERDLLGRRNRRVKGDRAGHER